MRNWVRDVRGGAVVQLPERRTWFTSGVYFPRASKAAKEMFLEVQIYVLLLLAPTVASESYL